MPKPKFNKRTLQSLEQLAGLRQQLADQEFEALRAAQEAAAARQQTAGKAAARASNILNNAKGVRQASTGRMHFTRGKSGSGIYVPVTSSGKVNPSITSTEAPLLTIKDVQMPAPPIIGRIRIKSSTDPFVNVTQSMQNAYDLGLPGLQSMFQADMSFMHSPLMQRLADRTGRTAQSISKQINPETGQIYTNYFGVVEPHYAQWRKLHEMAGKDRPTAEQAEVMFQTPQMKTIFSRMEELLGIKPSLYPSPELETVSTTVRKPYESPLTTVKSKYVAPNTLVTVNPDYLAHQAALKDMAESGIQYDARLEHPEWFVPSGQVINANDSGINPGAASGHFSTQGFTTRGHMFGEDLDSGLGDLRIIMGEPVDPRKPKRSRTWYPIDSGSREDEIVRFIGVNPNKTGMWKQGGILSAKSGIHIKKANRGKFTDYCGGKVTSECIARGKASSNPAIRKRATFAANARKWKHQNGGKIPFWVHNMLGGE